APSTEARRNPATCAGGATGRRMRVRPAPPCAGRWIPGTPATWPRRCARWHRHRRPTWTRLRRSWRPASSATPSHDCSVPAGDRAKAGSPKHAPRCARPLRAAPTGWPTRPPTPARCRRCIRAGDHAARFAKLRRPSCTGEDRMTEPNAPARQPLPLHWKIAIGFVAGLVLGLFVHYGIGRDAGWVQALTQYVTQPLSTLFLSLIFMMIVPLLFSALVVGVSEMGDVKSLGRIGWKTLACTVVLSGLAVLLGLVLVNLFKPGVGVDPVLAQQLLAESAERTAAIVRDSGEQPKGMQM